jgi:broad specificity phosphatase PhoE
MENNLNINLNLDENYSTRRESTTLGLNSNQEKFIFAFVGLPARGKSYISRKLATYLDWIGFDSKVFSVGVYRRSLIGVNCDWRFFENDNKETALIREKCVYRAIDDMISFLLEKGGRVGVIDGTNTKKEKRRQLEEYIKSRMTQNVTYSFIWIESICTLEDIVERNIIKTKLKSPDYKGWNEEVAVRDFRERISAYEKVYDHLSPENDGENCAYIQLLNYNSEIVVSNVKGFLQSKVLSYLVNLIPGDRPIYFTRHGLSENNSKDIIGGDSPLSEQGLKYAKSLYNFLSNEEFIKNKKDYKENCVIYCSTLKRCVQTAKELEPLGKIHINKCLDDLNVGICDGMSYEEIQEVYPKEFEERLKDKLSYRYPRGESYSDLILRIEPLIHELERRQGPVIVVGHQATLRCLYGYFTNTPVEEIPTLDFPRHAIIRKLPQAFGCNEKRFKINTITDEVTCIDPEIQNFEDKLYNLPEKKEL